MSQVEHGACRLGSRNYARLRPQNERERQLSCLPLGPSWRMVTFEPPQGGATRRAGGGIVHGAWPVVVPSPAWRRPTQNETGPASWRV